MPVGTLWRRLVSRITQDGAAAPCSARATATCARDQRAGVGEGLGEAVVVAVVDGQCLADPRPAEGQRHRRTPTPTHAASARRRGARLAAATVPRPTAP